LSHYKGSNKCYWKDGDSDEHHRSSSKSIYQETTGKCDQYLEEAQKHDTDISFTLISLLYSEKKLFCVLKYSCYSWKLIGSSQGYREYDEIQLCAFAFVWVGLKIFLIVYVSCGFVAWIDFDGNHFVLLYFELKCLQIGSIDSFKVFSNLIILSFLDVALDIVIGMHEKDNQMNGDADDGKTDQNVDCCCLGKIVIIEKLPQVVGKCHA